MNEFTREASCLTAVLLGWMGSTRWWERSIAKPSSCCCVLECHLEAFPELWAKCWMILQQEMVSALMRPCDPNLTNERNTGSWRGRSIAMLFLEYLSFIFSFFSPLQFAEMRRGKVHTVLSMDGSLGHQLLTPWLLLTCYNYYYTIYVYYNTVV